MSSPDSSAPVPPSTPTPAPRPGFGRRHWGKLTILTLLGLPLLVVTVWAGVALSYTYSTGVRTGYVQKLSKKGWLCKTWEGELAMATAPGVSPEIFQFSVRSDSLASAMIEEMGEGRLALTYDEHRGVPTSCFGDTPYFVVSYKKVGDAAESTPLP